MRRRRIRWPGIGLLARCIFFENISKYCVEFNKNASKTSNELNLSRPKLENKMAYWSWRRGDRGLCWSRRQRGTHPPGGRIQGYLCRTWLFFEFTCSNSLLSYVSISIYVSACWRRVCCFVYFVKFVVSVVRFDFVLWSQLGIISESRFGS